MAKSRKPANDSSRAPVADRELRARVFTLVMDMEGPLDQLRAFIGALDLMGFGLRDVDKDISSSAIVVAEAAADELDVLRPIWRKLLTLTAQLRDQA